MKLRVAYVAAGFVLGIALSVPSSVEALSITTTSGVLDTSRWEGDQTSQAQIDTVIAGILGPAIELYKQNVGGSESGALATSYETTFFDSPNDPMDALIHYVGGPVVADPKFLLVKDGNQTPAWYLFNLTVLGWNGTDDLDLQDFWPRQGAISHVTLYGTVGDGNDTVPEPGSLLLLGTAIAGLAARVRNRNKKRA
jgi:PEP-CTERM motif